MDDTLRILLRITEAADVYAADQQYETDYRVGAVQPITVEEGEELNEALREAWKHLEEKGVKPS